MKHSAQPHVDTVLPKSMPAYRRFSRACLLASSLLLNSLLTSHALAAELQPVIERIALHVDQYSAEDQTRVMLFSHSFSLLPSNKQSGLYLGNTLPPNVTPAAGAIGIVLGTWLVNQQVSQEATAAMNFKTQIEQHLQEINITEEIQQALHAALVNSEQFKQLTFEHAKRSYELAQPGLLVRIEEKQIMTLATSVSFDHAMKAILINAQAKLWLKDQSQPIYSSDFSYVSPAIAATGTEAQRTAWLANQGQALKERIRQGIQELSWMVAQDMHPAQDELQVLMENIQLTDPATGKSSKVNFYQTMNKPERLIGRSGTQESALMLSIPR